MNPKTSNDERSPTILVVKDSEGKTKLNSRILSAFNIIYSSGSPNSKSLTWIQQNQPDLIIVECGHFSKSCSSLITPLKLDWLTRDIPIIVVGNKFALKSIADLDYDACLNSLCSAADLDKAICSLVRIPVCEVIAG